MDPWGERNGWNTNRSGGISGAQECTALLWAAPALPLPWAMPLNLSSSAQHQPRAFANRKGCSGSWERPTAALQSSSGGHLLSRWLMKRFMFSFHISSVFLGPGSLPGRSCNNFRKRYPEVCHLINSPAFLHQESCALLSCTSPCWAKIYCFKTKRIKANLNLDSLSSPTSTSAEKITKSWLHTTGMEGYTQPWSLVKNMGVDMTGNLYKSH